MKTTVAVPPRFKPRLRQIQQLRISNRSFQDLWEEYCELLEALKPVEGGMKTLTRLKSELEKEIEEALDDKYRD